MVFRRNELEAATAHAISDEGIRRSGPLFVIGVWESKPWSPRRGNISRLVTSSGVFDSLLSVELYHDSTYS